MNGLRVPCSDLALLDVLAFSMSLTKHDLKRSWQAAPVPGAVVPVVPKAASYVLVIIWHPHELARYKR